ncbi:hypothetical protein Q7P37_003635 [Cladosporium fusiforme]
MLQFPSPGASVTRLLEGLPPKGCCDYLVTEFFTHISPLFDVLHGPTFQRQYVQYTQAPENMSLAWLALLFVVCASALNTVENDDPALAAIKGSSPLDTISLSRKLLRSALTFLSEDQFLFNYDLSTLQALLLAIYIICHREGVERGWVLLGTALNIAIALRCNTKSNKANLIDNELRRRCWAGVLMLHTYQGIIYRDINMSYLLNNNPPMLRDIENLNFGDQTAPSIADGSKRVTIMQFKIRLFALSAQVCSHTWNSEHPQEEQLRFFDTAIAKEQQQWDANFLVDGVPSVLDTASYAHWCILQTYAHQLYLLIHRPFHRSLIPGFRPESKDICLKSSMALLDLHQQLCEAPRLRNYRWLVNGMTSLNAFQGAVALASCLLDGLHTADKSSYQMAFDATVARTQAFVASSPVCAKTYPVLKSLQCVHSSLVYKLYPSEQIANLRRSHLAEHLQTSQLTGRDTDLFEEWIEQVDLPGCDPSEWVSLAKVPVLHA